VWVVKQGNDLARITRPKKVNTNHILLLYSIRTDLFGREKDSACTFVWDVAGKRAALVLTVTARKGKRRLRAL